MNKWINVEKSKPPKYTLVQAKGTWVCPGIIYEDDEQDGWDQKKRGQIEVTHWRHIPNQKRRDE